VKLERYIVTDTSISKIVSNYTHVDNLLNFSITIKNREMWDVKVRLSI